MLFTGFIYFLLTTPYRFSMAARCQVLEQTRTHNYRRIHERLLHIWVF